MTDPAEQKARELVCSIAGDVVTAWTSEKAERANPALQRAINVVAAALREAHADAKHDAELLDKALSKAAADCNAMKAECERLREGLRWMANGPTWGPDAPRPSEQLAETRKRARALLGETGEERG